MFIFPPMPFGVFLLFLFVFRFFSTSTTEILNVFLFQMQTHYYRSKKKLVSFPFFWESNKNFQNRTSNVQKDANFYYNDIFLKEIETKNENFFLNLNLKKKKTSQETREWTPCRVRFNRNECCDWILNALNTLGCREWAFCVRVRVRYIDVRVLKPNVEHVSLEDMHSKHRTPKATAKATIGLGMCYDGQFCVCFFYFFFVS